MVSVAPASTYTDSQVDAGALRALYQLDPNITFLNHGSFGATPRPVFEVYQAWQRQLEREPVAFVGRRQDTLLDAARGQIATWLNAGVSDISFVVNATSGLNVIARSIPLEPGDEILTTDLEYGALDLTWDYLCQKAGATYIHQPIPSPGSSGIERAMTFRPDVALTTKEMSLTPALSQVAIWPRAASSLSLIHISE